MCGGLAGVLGAVWRAVLGPMVGLSCAFVWWAGVCVGDGSPAFRIFKHTSESFNTLPFFAPTL